MIADLETKFIEVLRDFAKTHVEDKYDVGYGIKCYSVWVKDFNLRYYTEGKNTTESVRFHLPERSGNDYQFIIKPDRKRHYSPVKWTEMINGWDDLEIFCGEREDLNTEVFLNNTKPPYGIKGYVVDTLYDVQVLRRALKHRKAKKLWYRRAKVRYPRSKTNSTVGNTQ